MLLLRRPLGAAIYQRSSEHLQGGSQIRCRAGISQYHFHFLQAQHDALTAARTTAEQPFHRSAFRFGKIPGGDSIPPAILKSAPCCHHQPLQLRTVQEPTQADLINGGTHSLLL